MFIEHASRKLAGSAVDLYRDIKEEKVKKRIMTIALRPLVMVLFFGSMRASSQFKDSDRDNVQLFENIREDVELTG